MPGPGHGFILMQEMMQTNLWVDAVYTLLIILVCGIIYIKTRELYELTGHKGIGYFRNVFLFFAISYLFNFLIITPNNARGTSIPNVLLLSIFFITIYASTIAISYLVYSVLWKKTHKGFFGKQWPIFIIAFIIALIPVLFQKTLLFVIIQAALFIFAVIMSFFNNKRSKAKKGFSKLYFIYILLFVFWILNTFATALPPFFLQIKVFVYLISLILFIIIVWGVLKRINVKQK